jgi:general secretion pathway protein N
MRRALLATAFAVAAGLGAYAATLVALAPATLVDALLERASGGRLRLANAEGSLWTGSGWIEIRDAQGRAGIARALAWRVERWSFLRGSLVAQVEFDRAAPFPVTLSLSRIELARVGIRLPAAALGLGMPRLAPLRLTGDVLLDIPHLAIARGRMDGAASLQWRAAGSALTPVSPLGDYEVRFQAAGPVVRAALSTLSGPLLLEGNATWSNGSSPSFLATARVPAQHRDQLSPLFRLVAVERSAGSFEFNSTQAALGL